MDVHYHRIRKSIEVLFFAATRASHFCGASPLKKHDLYLCGILALSVGIHGVCGGPFFCILHRYHVSGIGHRSNLSSQGDAA